MPENEDEWSMARPGSPDWFKPITMEMSFGSVDPDVMALLTGQSTEDWAVRGPQQYAVEVLTRVPVRRRAWRVVWEFIRRTPRKYTERRIVIPHATVQSVEGVSGNWATRITPIHHTESDTP